MAAEPPGETGLGETRALLVLAWPVMITQLLQMSLGVVDMIMLGHSGVQPMAAATLANAYAMPITMACVGTVVGIDPLITQAHGAGDGNAVALALQRGLVLAFAVSLPMSLYWYFAGDVLLALGQPQALARAAGEYLRVQAWSPGLFLLFMTVRQYLQGRAIVRPAMYVLVLMNVLNALLDWAFIFGHLGLPALGLRGAGIAAGIARVCDLGLLLAFVAFGRLQRGAWRPWDALSFAPSGLIAILRLGVPIGLQWGLEVLAWGSTALMAGRIGEHAVSAHAICLNLASVTFMLPLGIAMGAATRVGNLIGEGAQEVARRTAMFALRLAVLVMAGTGVCLFVFRHTLPQAWTEDATVLALAASLLPIAALLQVFDGAQVVCAGILRGLGRTRAPALSHFLGYYVIGLPAGYWLAFHAGLGVAGLWWGLLIGLLVVGTSLVLWVLRALRRPLVRVAQST